MFICRYDQVAGLHCRRLHSSVPDEWRFSVISRVPVTASLAWPNARLRDRVKGRNNRWQHRLIENTQLAPSEQTLTPECGWKGGDKSGSSACKQSRSDRQGDEFVPNYTKRIDNDRPSHGRPMRSSRCHWFVFRGGLSAPFPYAPGRPTRGK